MIEFLREKQKQFIERFGEAMDRANLKWLQEQHEPVLRYLLQRWHLTPEFQALGLDKRITEPVHEIGVGVNRFGAILRVEYQFFEEPEVQQVERALKRLNNLLSERDFGLQDTGQERRYLGLIGIQNDRLSLTIDAGRTIEAPFKLFG